MTRADSWIATGGPADTQVSAIGVASDGNLFVGTPLDGVFRSTDNGGSWTPVNKGLSRLDIHTLSINDNDHLYVGTTSGFVYFSDNQGESWVITDSTGVSDIYAVGFTPAGQIFASGQGGVCRSTDSGSSWDELLGMPPVIIWSTVIVLDENMLIAGSLGMGVLLSTTAGTTWEHVYPGPPDNDIYSFFQDENGEIFAATGMGIYNSTDNGVTWGQLPNPVNSNISLLLVDQSDRLLAVTGEGVFVSDDRGENWVDATSGLGDLTVSSLALAGDGTIYAGTDGGVYVYQSVTSVDQPAAAPEEFSLQQNYPNPFNPTTAIRFQIADPGLVTLRIYDLLGQEIATLLNEELEPGVYTRNWDASGVTSGVYYYRLQAGNAVESRKMVLVR